MIDLGTGHGLVARTLANHFDRVIATDISPGMIQQAKSAIPEDQCSNLEFVQASAESLTFTKDKSVDMVVAGQAAHWFDYPRLFAELKRTMKPGGTLAFWGYTDQVFVDYPRATKMLQEFAYSMDKDALGPYWQQPGRSIVQGRLQAIQPPEDEWTVKRMEYEPGTSGRRTGRGTLLMEQRMTLAHNMEFVRTWSSFHGWQETHPDRKKRSAGGDGDCIDDLFEKIVDAEPALKKSTSWREKEVDVEWGTGLVLASKN